MSKDAYKMHKVRIALRFGRVVADESTRDLPKSDVLYASFGGLHIGVWVIRSLTSVQTP
jgi:hypothetical protein